MSVNVVGILDLFGFQQEREEERSANRSIVLVPRSSSEREKESSKKLYQRKEEFSVSIFCGNFSPHNNIIHSSYVRHLIFLMVRIFTSFSSGTNAYILIQHHRLNTWFR